jgi:arylsulfatase
LFDSEAEKYQAYSPSQIKAGVRSKRAKHIIYEGTTLKTRVEIGTGDVNITAHVEIPSTKTEGVIFANGGLTSGTSLFIKEGKLNYLLSDGLTSVILTDNKAITSWKTSNKSFLYNNRPSNLIG